MMPVYKFIRKHKTSSLIQWKPHSNLNYKPKKLAWNRWLIFNQDVIYIDPKETTHLLLNIGVELQKGLVIISLTQELKLKRCSIHNESLCENVDNILITLQNNTDQRIVISNGEKLCFINYYY